MPAIRMAKANARTQRGRIAFHVWGCRGSRNFAPALSRIGNHTSCYSLQVGADVLVFDAGRGLAALGYAMRHDARLAVVRRAHVFVTHAHMDHWEGLKDVEWFWRRGNGLQVSLYGTAEALDTIERGFAPPAYVPLELLALGTVRSVTRVALEAGSRLRLAGGELRTFALNHYSGSAATRRELDTLGYRFALPGGPVVAYVSDHEPTPATWDTERALVGGAHLAVYDAHFPDVQSQMHGHGSQEHAAVVARAYPGTLLLAGHHGPLFADAALRASFRRFGRGLRNYQLAVVGAAYTWRAGRFVAAAGAPGAG
jgi:phosphoribosyl 1,2-cyclic phosphodiesterase